MTKEQATEVLHELDGSLYDTQQVALDMAIKALEQQPCDDCVSRQEVIRIAEQGQVQGFEWQIKKLVALSPVTPTQSTCKDCKHWKDSDGVYRRGIGAESKCPINNSRVFEGTFYCADFEKRGSKNE